MRPSTSRELDILRIVVRNGFSRDLAVMLLHDLGAAIGKLEGSDKGNRPGAAFRH